MFKIERPGIESLIMGLCLFRSKKKCDQRKPQKTAISCNIIFSLLEEITVFCFIFQILLMVRDSEEEWYQSMHNQLKLLSTCGLYSSICKLSPHCAKLQKFLNNASKFGFQLTCASILYDR